MNKRYTLKECHEVLGTKPQNPRWSWSGRSADGKTDVTMPWVGTPGHKDLVENLKWAKEHCDGVVSVIIAIAKEKDAHPRTISECYPQLNFRMRVENIDHEIGEFSLLRIED